MDALFEKSPDGVALVIDGRIARCNARFASIMGRPVEQLLGAAPTDFPVAEQRDRVAERVRAVLAGGPEFPTEYDVVRPDGSVVPVEVLSQLVSVEGKPAMLSVVRDITDRKNAEQALLESEERFRRLAETAAAAIMIVRSNGILYANQAAQLLLGYTADEFAASAPEDIIHPEDLDAVRGRIRRRLQGDDIRIPYSYRVLTKGGQARWWETSATAIDYAGEAAVLSVSLDITERVRAEEDLQRVREALEGQVERQMQRKNPYDLTFRELTVLHYVAAGKADKEIAEELGISPLTAQKHVSNILRKMSAASRTEAGVRAIREELLS